MAAWLSKYGPLITKAAGTQVPLAMLLGHVQHESGGRPTDRTKLDERGLMQIHPGTSKEMGFDHGRMFDPAYSIWAGVEMYKRMADRLQREFSTLFPTRDSCFWHMVRFEFSIGSAATRQILRTMLAEGTKPRAWPQFTDYLARNRMRLTHLVRHDPIKWSTMVDKVFATGERLLHGGGAALALASHGGGVLVIGLMAAIAVYFYSRRQKEPV